MARLTLNGLFCSDCAIMGRDTSAMVIPSFYTRDDDAPRSCARSGPHHLAINESPSPALPFSFHPPPHHSGKEAGDGERDGPANVEIRTSGWRESEIITNLFLGDLQDAGRFDGMIISVLPDAMAAEPKRAIRLPFLANGRATLDSTSALIDAGLHLGMRVLIHCEEGCERAPLAIAWFLKTRRGMTLDEAYTLIKSRRPIVKDRRSWLGVYNR
jgi:hypothetical protein